MKEEQTNKDEKPSSDIEVMEGVTVARRGPYKKNRNKTSFLKPKGHDLDKAIKQSGRYLETALRTLVEISVDKQVDPKDRRMAAESLLKIHKDMVDTRDKDEIARLEREISKNNLLGNLSTVPEDEEEDDDTPQLDFENIHPDFRDNDPTDVEFKENVDKSED